MNQTRGFFKLFILFFYLPGSLLFAQPFVTAHLMGQFGNQLFIMAAATSLALDHGAKAVFPDLTSTTADPIFNIPLNYEKIFYHINAQGLDDDIEFNYYEQNFTYDPIPYHPNMSLFGWFQSEKYFAPHKQEILELFSPRPEILDYLTTHYADIIEHPKTVSIHMRSYLIEKTPEQQKAYVTHGRAYVEQAMSHFPEDSLFVVFSNQMDWCRQELTGIARNIRFIEGESHYHDFYLMSLCKDHIISNSSFSWWAAYLNRNPHKKIIVPPAWFSADYVRDTKDLIPDDWIVL